MAQILFVDDDPVVQAMGQQVLTMEGHEIVFASNGYDALERLDGGLPDLMILDIVMPDISGLEVCRRIRADPYRARLPIIFLTARSRPSDVAAGLDAGGDDYLTKEALSVELPARVRALLRRLGGGVLDPDSDELVVGSFTLAISRPELHTPDQVIFLTPVEHRVLHYLMRHDGQPVAPQRLLEDVWEYPPGTGDPRLVRTHIGNLRHKIEADPHDPLIIQNVHGRGYVFMAP
jgi:DNA-binding response OmpR family regulator